MHRPNHTDTAELRRQFAETFLASPQDHNELILDGAMDQLISEFDAQLSEAKKRWPSINADHEWSEMDHWLTEHEYIDPDHLDDSDD